METIHVILRCLQLLFLIILTALIGNVIALDVAASSSARAAIDFSMFVIVFSWLAALFGLAASLYQRIAIPLVMLALDALATLFTVIAGIVLAAKLGAVNCGHTDGHGRNWIAYGSGNDEKRCREIQAGTAFMWFLFAVFAAALTMAAMSWRRTGGGVRSGPTMSQVGV
ncbi:marvel domain-containing protein [Pseudoneurospora amorphoporcata]|uniref:Marvel domain-containing protein n=1 Tax=Pseudoneurospora amorphoporcata TaxID=241081 RepID=A0AAN6SGX3_9PEZI|nr:marvel domain-containing protein [Pseudoneurospora amorphoporcata]